jgi:hypothetical protein
VCVLVLFVSLLAGRGKIFLLSIVFRPPLGPTKPPIQWIPKSVFLGIKRPGRETDHSSPSGAEVKNGAAILSFSYTSSWRGA